MLTKCSQNFCEREFTQTLAAGRTPTPHHGRSIAIAASLSTASRHPLPSTPQPTHLLPAAPHPRSFTLFYPFIQPCLKVSSFSFYRSDGEGSFPSANGAILMDVVNPRWKDAVCVLWSCCLQSLESTQSDVRVICNQSSHWNVLSFCGWDGGLQRSFGEP